MFDGHFTVRQLRAELLAELRKPQPDWDFRDDRRCAIGIVRRIYGRHMYSAEIAARLGIPGHGGVFLNPRKYGEHHYDRVTQAMVANLLEELFSTNVCSNFESCGSLA